MSLNMRYFAAAVLILQTFVLVYTQIEVVPERAGIYDLNKKYVKSGKFFVNRYGRKSIYYANLVFELQNEGNNNISVEIVLFEKLGNEYKRGFIEIKQKMCDLINKDQLIGPSVRSSGVKCPISKGKQEVANLTLNRVIFPYKFPFEYARGDAFFYQTETREFIASGYMYFHLKQKQKMSRKPKTATLSISGPI